MKCFVLLAICLGISSAWPVKQNMDALEDPNWKAWKSFHKKSYVDEGEERLRNFIWQDNLKRIVSHNEVHKYKLAMNHLGDMVRFQTSEQVYYTCQLSCIVRESHTLCVSLTPVDLKSLSHAFRPIYHA